MKGEPNGKRSHTCNKYRATGHTKRTCCKNVNLKYVWEKPLDDLDLNKVYNTCPQYSPTNSLKDTSYNNTKLVLEKLMFAMPNFCIDCEIAKANVDIYITFISLSNSFIKNIIVSNNDFIQHTGYI